MGVTKEVVQNAAAGAQRPSKGQLVTVHCTGIVKESGKKFWSTKDPGFIHDLLQRYTATAQAEQLKGEGGEELVVLRNRVRDKK